MSNPTKTVDLQVSQILEDLSNGITWLKKDDAGNGSIQEKYGATEYNIKVIQKHPKFKDEKGEIIQPQFIVFNVIDDTEAPVAKVEDHIMINTKPKDEIKTAEKKEELIEVPSSDSSNAFFNI